MLTKIICEIPDLSYTFWLILLKGSTAHHSYDLLAETAGGAETQGVIERKKWALFIGPVGAGKSHLIKAIGHQACRMGYIAQGH